MTKSELPSMLHIPSVQLPGKGAVDIQLRDSDGNMAIPVWSSSDKAVAWLDAGGMELWTKTDSAMEAKLKMGGTIVVRTEPSGDYCSLLSLIGGARYLHYEPDHGHLFAPPERRISVK